MTEESTHMIIRLYRTKWLGKNKDAGQQTRILPWNKSWYVQVIFSGSYDLAQESTSFPEQGLSRLTCSNSRSGFRHASASSLYVSFTWCFCCVILISLSLSCWEISCASLCRACSCSCSSSWRSICNFWYWTFIINSLMDTYSCGDIGLKNTYPHAELAILFLHLLEILTPLGLPHQVPAVPVPMHLLANVPGMEALEGPSAWAFTIHMGDPDEVSASCHPVPATII